MLELFAAGQRKLNFPGKAVFVECDEILRFGSRVKRGCNDQAEFIDESSGEEAAVGLRSAFQKKKADAEFTAKNVEQHLSAIYRELGLTTGKRAALIRLVNGLG